MEQHLTASEATRQFLTFALGAEEYGVEIPKIQEIKGTPLLTGLAQAGEKLVILLDIDRVLGVRSALEMATMAGQN